MSRPIALYTCDRLIVSVFDASTAWPRPYIDAGYPTIAWDYQQEGCILQHFDRLLNAIDEAIEHGYLPYGLLLAPPCTDFSSAGAQFWGAKDRRPAPKGYEAFISQTEYSMALVYLCQELRARYAWAFWALENPPGRLEKLVPTLTPYRRHVFNPWQYGDPYTKKTILYGQFNERLQLNVVEPVLMDIKAGGEKKARTYKASPLWQKTGSGEKSRSLRSKTPAGFATAFYNANP